MNRRTLMGAGAAMLLAGPAYAQRSKAVPKELTGAWTGGHVGTNGRVPTLIVMKITIADNGEATYESSVTKGITGMVTTAPGGAIHMEFDPAQGFAGASFDARLSSPDQIDGIYSRGDGFATEVGLKRGDLKLTELPLPSLTQKGLEQTLAETGLPALAAIAVKANRQVQQWQAGLRKRGSAEKIGPNDIWALGRITMPMTATLAAVLVEKGKIKWTTTLGEVFGGGATKINDVYKSATLRDLLSHRAGLPAGLPVAKLGGFSDNLALAPAQRDLYATRVLAEPPVGALRTVEARPSFAGHTLAGAMLEKAAGRAYETLMAEEVFKPLGMTTAGFLRNVVDMPPTRAGAIDNPVGHDTDDELAMRVGAHTGCAQTPAAGAYMSLPDLMRFLLALPERAPILTADGWKALRTDSYGGRQSPAWVINDNGVLTQFGGTNGFTAQARISLLGGAGTPTGPVGTASAAVCNSASEAAARTVASLQLRASSSTVSRLPVQGSAEAFAYAAEFSAIAEQVGVKLN